jgi:hypothetical protein
MPDKPQETVGGTFLVPPTPPAHIPSEFEVLPPFRLNREKGEAKKPSEPSGYCGYGYDDITAEQREAHEDYGG